MRAGRVAALAGLLGACAGAAPAAPRVVATIDLAETPHTVNFVAGLALNTAASRLYVTGRYSGNMVTADVSTNKGISQTKGFALPGDAAVHPGLNRAYVLDGTGTTLKVVDLGSEVIIATVTVPGWGSRVAVDPGLDRVYVLYSASSSSYTYYYSYSATVGVMAVDAATLQSVGTAIVSSAAYSGYSGYGWGRALTVDPEVHKVYVAWSTYTYSSGSTSDYYYYGTAGAVLAELDGTTLGVLKTGILWEGYPSDLAIHRSAGKIYLATGYKVCSITLETLGNPVVTSGSHYADRIAVDPVHNRIFSTSWCSSQLTVLNTNTMQITNFIDMGGYTRPIVINPGAARVYVGGTYTNVVKVVDTGSLAVVATIDLSRLQPVAVAVNPATGRAYVPTVSYNSYGWSGMNKTAEVDLSARTVLRQVAPASGYTYYGYYGGFTALPAQGLLAGKSYGLSTQRMSDLQVQGTLTQPYTYPAYTSFQGFAADASRGRLYTLVYSYTYSYTYPYYSNCSLTLRELDAASLGKIADIPIASGSGYWGSPAVAVDHLTRRAYVVSPFSSNTVLVADLDGQKVVAQIVLPLKASALHVSPATQRLYVQGWKYDPVTWQATYGLMCLDTASNTLLRTIPLPSWGNVVAHPSAERVYFARATWSYYGYYYYGSMVGAGEVWIINTLTSQVEAKLPTGGSVVGLDMDAGRNWVAAANYHGTVTLIQDDLPAPIPPAPPSGPKVGDVPGDEGTALLVSWTANTESDLKDYGVSRATYSGVGATLVVARISAPGVTHQDGGLAKRATYYYAVTARNVSGNESAPSAVVSGVPVDNLPPQAPAAPAVTAPPEGRTLRLSWSAASAPDLAGYRVYRATFSWAGTSGGDKPRPYAASPVDDMGLSDGVTYYFRVTAVDDSGNESAGSPEASGVPQDIVPPVTPSGFGATDVPDDPGGVVRLVWGTGPEPDLAGYRLTRSKSSNGAWEKDEFLPAGVTVHLDVGLTDYVNYFYTLRAEDRAGNGSASVMVSTMPKPSDQFVFPPACESVIPVAPPLGRSAQVSWSLPAGAVSALVCVSTWPGEPGLAVYQGAGTSVSQGGLINGTTYFYTIWAVDGWGRRSQPVVASVVPKDTIAPGPAPSLAAGGGPVGAVTWSFPPDPDVDRAHVYVATFAYSTAAVYQTYLGTATSLSFSAEIGTTYYVSLFICDHDHNYSFVKTAVVIGPPAPAVTTAVAASTTTASSGGGASSPAVPAGAGIQAGPPSAVSAGVPPSGIAKAAVKAPTDGKRIRGNAVTVIAESADQPKGVLFQFRAEKESAWRDITSRDDKPPYAVYWNVSALANGPYRLRAVAYDTANRPDPAPGEVSVTVDDVNTDIVEDGNPSVDPNTPHRKEEKVSESQAAVVVVADGTKVEVPKGAVKGSASLTVTVVPPAEVAHISPPMESTLKSAGVYREFKVSGQATFEKPVTITLPYPDEDHDDVVDGTAIKKSDLRMHFRNEKTGEWEEVRGTKPVKIAHAPGEPSGALGAALYPQGNAVVASVDHFTLFGLFARAAKLDLSEVIVYPNPCLPSEGHAGVTFDGLPAGQVRVRIYTVSGRVVRDAAVESAGTWIWNLTTDDGEPAASGAYLYTVTAPGLGSAKGKVALVR